MINRITKYIGLIKHFHFILAAGLLIISASLSGQTDTLKTIDSEFVTGKVLDANTKEPVAAAQIQNLNYEAAATTDENGEFKITIASKTDVLLIKAIDFNATVVPVKGRDSISVAIYKDVFTPDYPEFDNIAGKTRTSFTTNATNISTKKEDLTAQSIDDILYSNNGGSLRAVTRSGGNTEMGNAMFIRGLNSVLLNTQPLIVVDGVIWNNYSDETSIHDGYFMNPLSNIDKNDIESITVIKDGTSLYGSKGGNGVILIKTQRGKDMATKIVFNMSAGLSETPSSMPLLNGDQYKVLITDLLETEGLSPQTIGALEYLDEDESSTNYMDYHNTTNWEDLIYQNGTCQNAHLSVNGGDERALYAFSLGYAGNKGLVNSTTGQRLNTRFNADFFLAKRIDLGLNIGFTYTGKTLLDDGVNFYSSPSYLAMIKAKFLNPNSYTTSGTLTSDLEDADIFGVGNPVAIIENALNTNKRYRMNLGLTPKLRLTRNLIISDQFDYSLYKVKESHYDPLIGTADRYIENYGISENCFQNQVIQNDNFFNDAQIRYTPVLNQKNNLNILAGLRYIYDSYNTEYVEGHNSGSDEIRNLSIDEEYITMDGANLETKSLSFYANADYNYNNRYFLTVTAALDASSRFGDNIDESLQMLGYCWGIFPSVNAAWLISAEDFMANISLINLLKLRIGYGITGNDAIDPYGKTGYFSSINYIDRANGLYISNIGNSKFQWETTTKTNIGLDLNILNNRIALSADVYSNSTDNLAHLNTLPEVAGSGTYWTNGGELTNKGFEVGANIKALNMNKLQWEIGASVGHYKNKITALPDGEIITSIYDAEILTAVDNSAGVFYGYETNGVFATTEEAEAANLKIVDEYNNETYFGAGDIHFTDGNNDNIINENDKKIIGDPNPDIYGSFNNAITYGNFTLNALCTFSYGNDVYNYLRANLESGSDYINQTTAMLNRWTYEGQETDMPQAYYGDPMGNARFSDRWIEDGSYLKLKSVSLTYKVPINSAVFDQLTVWISANNLLTLTNYLGRDPEFSCSNSVLYQGIDNGLLPSTRSYLIGIKLNL